MSFDADEVKLVAHHNKKHLRLLLRCVRSLLRCCYGPLLRCYGRLLL